METPANVAGTHTHDRILSRVVVRTAREQLNADGSFFQPVEGSVERILHGITQEVLTTAASFKLPALQNLNEVRAQKWCPVSNFGCPSNCSSVAGVIYFT